MRCLVIGGTRMIGPPIVHRLHESGWDVAVLHRGVHVAPLPKGVTALTSAGAGIPVTTFPTETRTFAPDVVLHIIAMGESDSRAAMAWFDGYAGRIVAVSSGDVYRAYGRFIGLEPGPIEPTLLSETSPLRDRLHPYRSAKTDPTALEHWYDKRHVERNIMSTPGLPGTVLRLPKVYGPTEPDRLATIYGFRHQPQWRWTHGFLDNVAAAIALAVTDQRATGQIFNVGEPTTPTMAERLTRLADIEVPLLPDEGKDFAQDIAYDTSKIRNVLGFKESVDEPAAMAEIATAWSKRQAS